jgi:hypothetical protein
MVIHLPGLRDLNKPPVLAFPDLRICMDCGSKELAIPESVLRQLGTEAATSGLHTSPTREMTAGGATS